MCLETLSVPVTMNILEMESHVLVGNDIDNVWR